MRRSGRCRSQLHALEQPHLEDLAGHHHFGHPVPLKIADGGAELGQAEPAEIVADPGQARIGVADHAQAIDLAALRRRASAITTG